MKKIILSLLLLAGLGFSTNAQNVNIPDANFKAYLVGNTAINTNMDTEIQVSEAVAFSGSIDCGSLSIADLTGIASFTSLSELTCFNNQLTTLDLSSNISLTFLHCTDNLLSSLNIANNTALTYLNCSNNPLLTLNVSTNTMLTNLICTSNQLTSLDVSTNTALTYLNCQFNQLSTLNLISNTALLTLNCMFNQLTVLTFPNSISTFQCTNNQLTSLDLSGNTALTVLTAGENQLTSLNVKNGNNANMNNSLFGTIDNPNLTCIEVDDAAYSTANWTYIDATTSFSEDCIVGIENEQSKIMEIILSPNPTSSNLTVETDAVIETISIFNIAGELVQQETSNSFSVAQLPSGIYMLQVYSDKAIQTKRFVKD